jgi:hypothetical protein
VHQTDDTWAIVIRARAWQRAGCGRTRQQWDQ